VGWTGPVQIKVTIPELQALLNREGGFREKNAPIAKVTGVNTNILSVQDANGNYLAQVAWRPHEKGLFICG